MGPVIEPVLHLTIPANVHSAPHPYDDPGMEGGAASACGGVGRTTATCLALTTKRYISRGLSYYILGKQSVCWRTAAAVAAVIDYGTFIFCSCEHLLLHRVLLLLLVGRNGIIIKCKSRLTFFFSRRCLRPRCGVSWFLDRQHQQTRR